MVASAQHDSGIAFHDCQEKTCFLSKYKSNFL